MTPTVSRGLLPGAATVSTRVRHAPARRRQRGVAMLLIVLMLGVAVGTSTLLIWHAVRSTQEQQLTIHATTPAQASAWRGVEVLRRWLDALDEDVLEAWADDGGAVPVTFAGAGDPGFSARLIGVRAEGSAWRVDAEVTGRAAEGGTAQASATVEVVYEVAPDADGGGSPGSGAVSAINIHRDLDLRGNITVVGGEAAVFNVDGDASLDSASITGIDTLRATGDIAVGSNIHVRNIHADGDVVLRGSASGTQVRARGGVTVSGGSHPVALRANGPVLFSGGSGDLVESKTGVTVTGGGVTIASIRSEGPVSWTGQGGGANRIHANGAVAYSGGNRPTTIRSRADVRLPAAGIEHASANGRVQHAAWGTVAEIVAIGGVDMSAAGAGRVRSRGDVRLTGHGGIDALETQGSLDVSGSGTVRGVIGGTIRGRNAANAARTVTVRPGHQVPITPVEPVEIDEVPEVVMPSADIDAWPLRALANYVFEVEGGRRMVTVADVSGIPDGRYALGIRQANNGSFPDWLCRPEHLQGNGVCSTPVATICQGHSAYNGCVTVNGRDWRVDGRSLARGVAWFDGNLTVGNGTYVNTFIATGNIATSGSHRTLSPNYAGHAVTCANAAPPGGSLAPDFRALVPTNLCDVEQGAMTGLALGNIAYLAGGQPPGGGGFVGGDIALGASTRADGAVLAGNVLTTGGSTTISGAIVAAAQGGGGQVAMGGSTRLDLTGGADAYDPGGLPCGMVECEEGGTAGTRVVWTRYR